MTYMEMLLITEVHVLYAVSILWYKLNTIVFHSEQCSNQVRKNTIYIINKNVQEESKHSAVFFCFMRFVTQ